MQLISFIVRYSAALFCAFAAWIALIAAVVIVAYWEGVLEYLVGA